MAGLEHLHQLGIVHADIKPDNLVVNEAMSALKVSLLLILSLHFILFSTCLRGHPVSPRPSTSYHDHDQHHPTSILQHKPDPPHPQR
jgi:serine/threonine protein kinase